MELPADGAAPLHRAQYTAHMRDDLPGGAYVIRIWSQVRAAGRI